MLINIFTITHKKFTCNLPDIYTILHVGKKNSQDLGYLGDDTGDNISDKNRYYSELTGQYWIWKNDSEDDYVGLCHYRRYFINDNKYVMRLEEYVKILLDYDIIIAKHEDKDISYYQVYKEAHNIHDLDMAGLVIKELYPDYYNTFLEVENDNKCYVGNLIVTSNKYFKAYSEWLFTILFELEKRINVDNYDLYHRRVFGFISEQLLIVWIKKNNLNYYESSCGLTQEKAETIELEQQIKALLADRKFYEVRDMINIKLFERPDLTLEASDLKGNLNTLISITDMCIVEEENNINKSLKGSLDDIDSLIEKIKQIKAILEMIKIEDPDSDKLKELDNNIDQIISSNLSWLSINSLVLEMKLDLSSYIKYLDKIAMIYLHRGKSNYSIPFLDLALTLEENNDLTLLNIIEVLDSVGECDLALEYRNKLNKHKK